MNEIKFETTNVKDIKKICKCIVENSEDIKKLITIEIYNDEKVPISFCYTDSDLIKLLGYIEIFKQHILEVMDS